MDILYKCWLRFQIGNSEAEMFRLNNFILKYTHIDDTVYTWYYFKQGNNFWIK
jgi:hypothetical protein